MPRVYLSPSLQEFNPFVNGGTEEEYMNLIADAMEAYLTASGIEFVRNSPEMTLGEAIAQSNNSNIDFHLAIHSNASPASIAGQRQGPVIYYFGGSEAGEEMADIIEDEFEEIYPDEDKVQTMSTVTLRELRRPNAPSVLVEVAYHDNVEDANWIKNNIQPIARALSRSLADYFGIPFIEPMD